MLAARGYPFESRFPQRGISCPPHQRRPTPCPCQEWASRTSIPGGRFPLRQGKPPPETQPSRAPGPGTPPPGTEPSDASQRASRFATSEPTKPTFVAPGHPPEARLYACRLAGACCLPYRASSRLSAHPLSNQLGSAHPQAFRSWFEAGAPSPFCHRRLSPRAVKVHVFGWTRPPLIHIPPAGAT